MEKENQRLKSELQSKETELQTIKVQKVRKCGVGRWIVMVFLGGGSREDPRTGGNNPTVESENTQRFWKI